MGGVDDEADPAPTRGFGDTQFRDARCKDCLREQLTGRAPATDSDAADANSTRFEYSEAWATKMLDRGGSRTDRCARHRREHRQTIQGIAVAYVDLETVGEVSDRVNPTGPLGGLGELPATHRAKPVSVDLSKRQFGMTDDDIRKALRLLGNDKTRVLVLKAGTGTGKSTFGPYRLMNPPTDQPGDAELIQLTKLGPIVVTEPRVQATTGVARFVGEKLVAGCKWKSCNLHGRFVPAKDADPENPEGPDHDGAITDECVVIDCTDHIGPGYPVGYQVKDDKKHDDSCQLIFVTDGTMVNWLREGRLSKIGTVIVDEAHERSVNIDFIMGELNRQLPRYPHLRVIVTSATFDVDFYVSFFGGKDIVAQMDVPAVKTFGYGAPFFPLDSDQSSPPCVCPAFDPTGKSDTPHKLADPHDLTSWMETHWPNKMGPVVGGRGPEDLHATTQKLESLRYDGPLINDFKAWGKEMPAVLTAHVIRMINGLDEMGIHGDLLAFLPTAKMIATAVADIEAAIPADRADIYGLVGSMSKELQNEALAARPSTARRKIVIATNLAETSLTVEGVRFVVDSGIITQSTWDPITASGDVPTREHSQSGIRQRWGRVGRDAPGWAFPLYSAEQFSRLPRDTPPGSTRENLEKLIMTAKAGGVDRLEDFDWPADWEFGDPDQSAIDARTTFLGELKRAEKALVLNGVVDPEHGHLTAFGKEMLRFSVVGASAATALAIMFADQLACVPEVTTALALLDTQGLFGRDRLFITEDGWPFITQMGSKLRLQALRLGCSDDLDLVLRVAAGWDHADPKQPPWEVTEDRIRWCQHWWLNENVLAKAADNRRETLAALSPAMKEEVKRFIDPRLAARARAVLSRAMTSLQYTLNDDGKAYASVVDSTLPPASLDSEAWLTDRPDRILALQRGLRGTDDKRRIYLKHLVRVLPWACADGLEAFDLIELAAREVSPRRLPDFGRDPLLDYLGSWPAGMRFEGTLVTRAGRTSVQRVRSVVPPALPPRVPEAGAPKPRSNGDSNWLLGEALPDDDELQRRPVDTADDPTDPEKGLENNDDESDGGLVEIGSPEDVLAAWTRTSAAAQLEHPDVTDAVGRVGDVQPSTFMVAGYRLHDDGDVHLELTTGVCAVLVSIPASKIGTTLGGGKKHLLEYSASPGILSVELLQKQGALRIVGTSAAAVESVLGRIDKVSSVTGAMRMPDINSWKRLIGSGGSIKDALLKKSGCTQASLKAGTVDWTLTGPTALAVQTFIGEASKLVPGCTGEVATLEAFQVRDLLAATNLQDWRTEGLSCVSAADLPSAANGQGLNGTAADGAGSSDWDTELPQLVRRLSSDLGIDVELSQAPHESRATLAAFLFGLAHAVPGGTCVGTEPDTYRVSWPRPALPTVSSLDGRISEFPVLGFDSSMDGAARAIRLGRPSLIQIEAANQSEYEQILYYFVGIASALKLKLSPGAQDRQILVVRP